VGLGIQGSYSKMAAFATSVQKKFHRYGGKTAPMIPPKNTIKKFKKRVKI
jgi:hypothetical protein